MSEHICPVQHGAEREMELQWVCETCGHREDADYSPEEESALISALREDLAELTAAVTENEPKIQALVAALRHVANKGHYGAQTATIIDKALLPFDGSEGV